MTGKLESLITTQVTGNGHRLLVKNAAYWLETPCALSPQRLPNYLASQSYASGRDKKTKLNFENGPWPPYRSDDPCWDDVRELAVNRDLED